MAYSIKKFSVTCVHVAALNQKPYLVGFKRSVLSQYTLFANYVDVEV